MGAGYTDLSNTIYVLWVNILNREGGGAGYTDLSNTIYVLWVNILNWEGGGGWIY